MALVYSTNPTLFNQIKNPLFRELATTYNNLKQIKNVPCFDMLSDMEDLSIEWEGIYGKHWVSYSSEEEMQKALDSYQVLFNEHKEFLKLEERYSKILMTIQEENWYKNN